jgi:hypothetical protein
MGFYIRKSSRAGPVRLNLSKSGFGLSGGVKGLRVGSGPRGDYMHAGRKGLYYRQSLGKGKSSRGSGKADTGGGLGLLGFIIGIVILVFVINWFIENPAIFFFLLAVSVTILGTIFYREFRRKNLIKNFKNCLDNCFILNSQPLDEANISKIRDLKSKLNNDQKLNQKTSKTENDAYEALLDKILDDKLITSDEKQSINIFETIIPIDDDFKNEVKKDIFKSYYLEAVADHKITIEEIETLKNLISGLNIKQEMVKDELKTVKEIIRMQKLNLPLKSLEDVPIKIQKSETAYYSDNAKVLTRRKARRKDDSEYEYSVKRDGKFVITDKRVLVADNGTTAVKLGDIVDVDVDIDSKMIFLSKSTSSKPLIIQSQEPLYAGKIIDLLTQ